MSSDFHKRPARTPNDHAIKAQFGARDVRLIARDLDLSVEDVVKLAAEMGLRGPTPGVLDGDDGALSNTDRRRRKLLARSLPDHPVIESLRLREPHECEQDAISAVILERAAAIRAARCEEVSQA